MSNRLDQEREKKLQPKRIAECADKLSKMGFDVVKAQNLHADLLTKTNLLKLKLDETFKDWVEDLGTFVPKVNSKKFGYVKGVPVKKTKVVKFKTRLLLSASYT